MTKQAFTLIELLVVVAIIAILAALLIPGINIVRDNANLANCASNQRQIVLAMVSYKADDGSWPCRPTNWNGAVVPGAFSGNDAGADDLPVYTTVSFEWMVNKMDGQLPPRTFVCPARKNNIPPVANEKFRNFSESGGWAPPEGSNAKGPSWRPDANNTGKPNVMAYAYDWAVPRKAAPNRVILADRPLDTGGKSMRSTHGRRGEKYRVNVAFVDGHVESILARIDPLGNTSGWTHNQNLKEYSEAKVWESDLNTDEDQKMNGDNIYSSVGDGYAPKQVGRGSPARAWVK